MLHILGVGAAYAPQQISNQLLVQLGGAGAALAETSGVSKRSTVMSLEYLSDTGNSDPWIAKDFSSCSPSDLSLTAAQKAIAQAGISPEQIGLVLGETSTPLETTPSEGQRIAGKLGLRVPAYDVLGSSGSLLLQIDTLFKWRPEVVPDYVLLVTANTPTRHINYREGSEGGVFGDAGGAIVVSPRTSGGLRVLATSYSTIASGREGLNLDTYGFLKLRTDFVSDFVEPQTERMLREALKSDAIRVASTHVVGSDISPASLYSVAQRCGFLESKVWTASPLHGHSLGTSPVCALSEAWGHIATGEDLLIAVAGSGLSCGFIHVKA